MPKPVRAPRAPEKPPETLWQLVKLLARSFVRSLAYNIPLMLGLTLVSWLLHTYLLVGPNGGFDPATNPLLDNVLVLRGRFLSGTLFWTLLGTVLSALFSRLRRSGLSRMVRDIVSTPVWLRDGLWGTGWLGLPVALFAAAVAALISIVPRSWMVSLQLALLALGALTEQERSLPAMVVRLGWSDGQRLLRPGHPVRSLPIAWAAVIVAGGAIGSLAVFVIKLSPCLGFPGLFLGVALLVAVIALRGNRPALGTLLLAFVFAGVWVIFAQTVRADDGGWAEAGGNLRDWIRSQGAAIAVAMGLPAAFGTAIGALLGSLLGVLPGVAPATTLPDLSSLFAGWPALQGGPADNPYTAFDGGDGPGRCTWVSREVGLPNYWVNTATLRLVVRDTLFAYEGLGPALAFTLTYTANPERPSMLGRAWVFSYGSSIHEDGEYLLLLKGSGQGLRFRRGKAPAAGAPGEAANLDGARDRLLDYGNHWLYVEHNSRWLYRYDKVAGGARLAAISDPSGNSIQLAYAADGTLQTITDAAGRVTRLAYDSNRRCVSLTTPDGRQATLAYDAQGNLAQVVDLAGIPTLYQYDGAGYIVRMVVGHDHKATTFTYQGAQGRVSAVTDPEGRTRRYELLAENPCQVRVIDAAGHATVYVSQQGRTERIIDALGAQTVMTYAGGLLVSKQDRTGAVTRMEYDGQGNLIRRVDAAGRVTAWTYDSQGQVLSVTNPLGQTTTYVYDAHGHRIKEILPSGKTRAREYDERGQLVAVIDGAGGRTTFTRDRFGNVIEVSDPLGNTTRIAWDSYGLTRLARTDPRGHTTRYEYDRNGRLTKEIHPDGACTEHIYDCCAEIRTIDENGHALEMRRTAALEIKEWVDALGNAWHWEHDGEGRPVRLVDPLGHSCTWEHDAVGRVVAVRDALGQTVRFAYDAEGHLSSFADEQGRQMRLACDANGLPVRVTDPKGNTTMVARDALGRIQTFTNARGGHVSYAYDTDGWLAATYHEREVVATFAYDAAGQLAQIRDNTGVMTISYDSAGRAVAIRYASGQQASFAYDEAGNLCTVTYPGGLVAKTSYDARGRPSEVLWGGHRLTCSYDAAGNLLTEARSNGTQSVYAYDARNLLTEIRHSRGEEALALRTYTRDAVGNIVSEAGTLPLGREWDLSPVAGVVDAGGQLVSWGGEPLTYDADGNLTAIGSRWQAAYDAENRLIGLTCLGVTRSYAYNGLGQRVRVETPAGVRLYHYDLLGRLLFETDGQGGLVACYLYRGPFLAARVAPDGETLFYHYDQRGSTLFLTDGRGEVAVAYAYAPWGAVVAQQGMAENPFTFVGACGVLDDGHELFFMRSRYYHAALARFTQRDPIGLAGGWNQYAYADNNPISRIDPMGYMGLDLGDWKFWVGSAMGALGGAMLLAPTGFTQVLGVSAIKVGTGLMIGGGVLDVYSVATANPDKMVERARGNVDLVNRRALIKDDKTGKWIIDPDLREVYDEKNLHKLQNTADHLNAMEEEASRKKKQWFCVFW